MGVPESVPGYVVISPASCGFKWYTKALLALLVIAVVAGLAYSWKKGAFTLARGDTVTMCYTLSLIVIACHSLGICTLILLPLLSFSVKMTVSRAASSHIGLHACFAMFHAFHAFPMNMRACTHVGTPPVSTIQAWVGKRGSGESDIPLTSDNIYDAAK
jgi:hypothetical protein